MATRMLGEKKELGYATVFWIREITMSVVIKKKKHIKTFKEFAYNYSYLKHLGLAKL